MNQARNPVGWFEIYVADMERAMAFYETMLDTKLEALPSPDPSLDSSLQMMAFPIPSSDDCGGELPGAGGTLAKMDGMTPGGGGTLVYFSCPDCAVEEARAAEAGGQIIKPKFSIGDYGFISLLNDTEGNMIGLHSLQ